MRIILPESLARVSNTVRICLLALIHLSRLCWVLKAPKWFLLPSLLHFLPLVCSSSSSGDSSRWTSICDDSHTGRGGADAGQQTGLASAATPTTADSSWYATDTKRVWLHYFNCDVSCFQVPRFLMQDIYFFVSSPVECSAGSWTPCLKTIWNTILYSFLPIS